MLDKLQQLEREALLLEPKNTYYDVLNSEITGYAKQFIEELDDARAYVADNGTGEGIRDFDITDEPEQLDKLIEAIDKHVAKVGLNPASGGHLGYIPGGGVYPSALGDYLADVLNSYAGVFFGSAGAVRMENMLIRWMCKIIGFPEGSLGNLTSGGSIANLIAMTTARDKKLAHSDDYKNAVIYLTEQIHHSVTKSIRIAGFGNAHIRHVKMDDRFRMQTSHLQEMVEQDRKNGLNPFLVVASAGTTDTGSVDPLEGIASICEEHNLWFHVDAAYGGFFVLCDEVRDKFNGIELADSVTIDPHKGLFLPYGLGAILIKDVKALNQAHYYKANYMRDVIEVEEEPSPAELSPELTKPFRGLRMWLPLKLFGLKPFKAAIEEKIWLCRYFYEEIQKIDGIEVGPYPELSVAIWRFVPKEGDPNEANQELANEIKKDGRVFMSSTVIDGDIWMRVAVLSFRTHKHTIDKGVQLVYNILNKREVST